MGVIIGMAPPEGGRFEVHTPEFAPAVEEGAPAGGTAPAGPRAVAGGGPIGFAALVAGELPFEAACAEATGGVGLDWVGEPRAGAGGAAGPAGEMPADRGDAAAGPFIGG